MHSPHSSALFAVCALSSKWKPVFPATFCLSPVALDQLSWKVAVTANQNLFSVQVLSLLLRIVSFLSSWRSAFFLFWLWFHVHVSGGLHRIPVPLCNWLVMFMLLVISSRWSVSVRPQQWLLKVGCPGTQNSVSWLWNRRSFVTLASFFYLLHSFFKKFVFILCV